MGKKVFIKTIPRDTASKVSEFRNINEKGVVGNKMGKTKISDNCKDGIQALYSLTIGGLKTGLYHTTTNEDGKKMSLQEYAENKWGLNPGFLTNKSFRKGDAISDEKMSYFQKKVWKLNDGTTVLDLDKLDDFCFYHVCLESKFVANSEKEWKEHKWPKATHYISLENETEEIKYKKVARKSLAIAKLHDSDFTLPWKRKFCVLLGLSNTRNILGEEAVNNNLYEMIMEDKRNPDGVTQVDLFEQYFAKFKTADGKERLEKEYLLSELLDYFIVTEKQGTYKWRSKGMDIGFTKTETVDFLSHAKKQSQVEELEKELKLKKGELI
jgi:hypothetical protein